ncbi:MAG: transporter [Bacteroidetes bacterium GWE2_39_28]|nr:MAG: transporter [Bacteroidetes bacterium GWE2_39_28]OFY13685.1 MAG: transporter [Bacteroidetes bacterium GWF2_39_10]OFZ10606.1 MAG: transporter [Bacteroidetes bacterium RIFOXYC2_FULL_39_11]
MEWLINLFASESVAQSVVILAAVISVGILLSKIKIANISFGITWILFAGIAFSHFGLKINPGVLHFAKEFGLILFVYSIGLQVGPGFFSSFKKGGIKLNLIASGIVLAGVATTLVIHYATSLPMSTMTGILSGAITNTPGLGAAQQTYLDINGSTDPSIAMGYAVAYPLGVLGIIFSILLVKIVFRINLDNESEMIKEREKDNPEETLKLSVQINNPAIFGRTIEEVKKLSGRSFVISRVWRSNDEIKIAGAETMLGEGNKVLVILQKADKESVIALLGRETEFVENDWSIDNINVVPRRVLVTKDYVNGKSLSELKLGKAFGITVTRINRAGVDLVAKPNLKLQIGDRLTIVGTSESIDAAAKVLGNSMHRLREPNLAAIFLGIVLGIILGSIPFFIPGIPLPVKLGLAGGPLIIAILMSKFGPKFKLVTYTTMSANLMLREVGISLFLACVGLDAGGGFVDTIINQGGAVWILYGAIITIVPLFLMGAIGRWYFKLNYFTLMGLMAGSTTDPPALAYANSAAGNDLPAVSYATVYPLTMFLRVLTAQLLILFF